MSAASASAVAAAYSSISQHSFTSPSTLPSNPPLLSSINQRSAFHGLQLLERRRVSSIAEGKRSWGRNGAVGGRKGLEISARTAGASKSIEVEVDKPLGLTLGQKPGGGIVITAVDAGGNAAKAGLKAGDQVLYTSSFFGDELWPADKLGFTKTAIQAKPDSVYFVNQTILQPDTYVCPQCNAPKKRFARYDVNTGKPIGGSLPPIGVIIGLVAGIAAVGALLVYGLR
ncbi:putative Electron transporter [Cocos nucifera]|uniref:Putative Electron transporter n=1 Tax=Cocos nucifera TaxID=13894 RepID=A0A8K0II35_COCNU|nr:putative Electron transporter [Cocos nucifera]